MTGEIKRKFNNNLVEAMRIETLTSELETLPI